MVFVLDNLDRVVKKVVQHQTLAILLSRDVSPHLEGLDDSDRKTIDEAKSFFTYQFLNMESEINKDEKTSFLEVLWDS